MSNLTGQKVELLYASVAQGTAKNTFTAETNLNDAAGMGVPFHFPRDFWLPNNNQIARGIRITAKLLVSSTGTPTFTPTIRLGTTAAATTGSIILGATAGLTTISGASNQIVDVEGDVFLKTIGAPGTNSTVQGVGTWISSGFANVVNPLYGGAASPGTVATVDTSVENYVNVNCVCGTSSASNQIQLLQLLIFGLN